MDFAIQLSVSGNTREEDIYTCAANIDIATLDNPAPACTYTNAAIYR
jgi:hypothetical protein